MAPGRKQKHIKVIKSSNAYVHPSLATNATSTAKTTAQKDTSVNERIEYLRRVQTPRLSAQDRENQNPALLPRLPDRGRASPRVAGPRPPRSWVDGSLNFKHGSSVHYAYERRPPNLRYFPGIEIPPTTSLLHQATKALAVNFEWHREYDHYYLATLPVSQKKLLLTYIARYGPNGGIEIDELRLLFSSQDEIDTLAAAEESPLVVEATGCEDLDRLDLGGSIGRKVLIKQLDRYWTAKRRTASNTPEQWDSSNEAATTGPVPSVSSTLRFPSLTKLSLAYPGRDISWPDLLHFSRHLGALTHLSLARWPTPRNSNAIIEETSLAQRPSTALPATVDLDEAVDALRILSRNTPSLQYLSLAGCEFWHAMLRHVSTAPTGPTQPRSARRMVREFGHDDPSANGTSSSGGGTAEATASDDRFVDFTTSWRHIVQLDLTQSTPPPRMDAGHLAKLHARRAGPLSASRRRLRDNRTGEGELGERLGVHAELLAEMACREHARLRPAQSRVAAGEVYRIVAPNASVADQMKHKERVRAWCERECDALDVGWFVKAQRVVSQGKGLEVVHGWGKQELLDAGYEEAELFEAGF